MELPCEPSELYVLSDLHLGGAPGFQAFNQGPRLAALIQTLRARDPSLTVALVLNGDIVDFLAEEPVRYLDPEGAIGKLTRVMQDSAFREVWAALAAFVATPNRFLVLALGNYDVELALPHVQNYLTEQLSRGVDAARGRIGWATDGSGVSCAVGDKRVLCVHGNEVDPWNVVDQPALAQLKRAWSHRTAGDAWKANGGTRLVVDVMNGLKRAHPIVDLLKPEREAAIPTLLALRPEAAKELGRAIQAASRRAWDALRMATGFLGDDGSAVEAPTITRGDPGAWFAISARKRAMRRSTPWFSSSKSASIAVIRALRRLVAIRSCSAGMTCSGPRTASRLCGLASSAGCGETDRSTCSARTRRHVRSTQKSGARCTF